MRLRFCGEIPRDFPPITVKTRPKTYTFPLSKVINMKICGHDSRHDMPPHRPRGVKISTVVSWTMIGDFDGNSPGFCGNPAGIEVEFAEFPRGWKKSRGIPLQK